MAKVTFITGNANKAAALQKYLGVEFDHRSVDQDEVQSLDLREVVTHKAKQAYALVGTPVFVEDVCLEFDALGRLPGTFIKHFIDEIGLEGLCRLLDGFDSRGGTGRTAYGFCDERGVQVLEGSMRGTIPDHPRGESGFGWDPIFIPDGYELTRAQLPPDDYEKVYRTIKPVDALAEIIKSL